MVETIEVLFSSNDKKIQLLRKVRATSRKYSTVIDDMMCTDGWMFRITSKKVTLKTKN